MSDRKHIVIISIWYPPTIGVAVNRIHSFAKYLDKQKFEVSVICLSDNKQENENKENIEIHYLKNSQLLKLPKFNKPTNRLTHYLKVSWKLLVMKIMKDEYNGWKKEAIKTLNLIHNKKPIDVIISSFSPVAPHLVALNLKKKYNHVKWIVDMRDEMSANPQLTPALKTYYQKIEKEINQYADALITVSLPIVNYFKELLPNIKYFEEIRNGYDHNFEVNKPTFHQTLTFLYAGNFYGNRKPDTFFKALMAILKKEELPNFIIKFVGTPKNFSIPKEIEKNCLFINKVSQKESIEMMRTADINLLIQPFVGRKGVYTGKIFDYLSVQKPILAVIDKEDVAANLIKEINAGYIADFNSIFEIETALQTAIKNWKNHEIPEMDTDKIEKLHRKYQVKKIEHLIEKIS